MQDELRDIHLPDPVSWWPPAPGWYAVFCLLILLSVVAWWLARKWRRPSFKKLALLELQSIEQSFVQHKNTQRLCGEISILLRRVAMSYDARDKQASVTGQAWLEQLNNLCGQNLFTDDIAAYLLLAPYQKQSAAPAEKLIAIVRQWISLLPTNSRFSISLHQHRPKKNKLDSGLRRNDAKNLVQPP